MKEYWQYWEQSTRQLPINLCLNICTESWFVSKNAQSMLVLFHCGIQMTSWEGCVNASPLVLCAHLFHLSDVFLHSFDLKYTCLPVPYVAFKFITRAQAIKAKLSQKGFRKWTDEGTGKWSLMIWKLLLFYFRIIDWDLKALCLDIRALGLFKFISQSLWCL